MKLKQVSADSLRRVRFEFDQIRLKAERDAELEKLDFRALDDLATDLEQRARVARYTLWRRLESHLQGS